MRVKHKVRIAAPLANVLASTPLESGTARSGVHIDSLILSLDLRYLRFFKRSYSALPTLTMRVRRAQPLRSVSRHSSTAPT